MSLSSFFLWRMYTKIFDNARIDWKPRTNNVDRGEIISKAIFVFNIDSTFILKNKPFRKLTALVARPLHFLEHNDRAIFLSFLYLLSKYCCCCINTKKKTFMRSSTRHTVNYKPVRKEQFFVCTTQTVASSEAMIACLSVTQSYPVEPIYRPKLSHLQSLENP